MGFALQIALNLGFYYLFASFQLPNRVLLHRVLMFFFFFQIISFRGEDDYLPGNITEIELHNFMTFNDLKCKPGSRLNLVIGPNGSGKSSLVCAIALGLGGDPQVGEVLILIVSFFKLKLRSVLL